MTDLVKPAKAKRLILRASDIHAGMRKRWGAPEWAIMWEVGEGTGANVGRYADAVMMSLWPSRGLELHGVEVKVSRSDWKREAQDPRKAEAVAKYCDRWWIHTPPGIVEDVSELPPAWGLREFDGKVWRTIREAEKTDAAPISRPFLAAMLRRADGIIEQQIRDGVAASREGEQEREKERNERFAKAVEEAADRKTRGIEKVKEKLESFEAAFGKGLLSEWSRDPATLGRIACELERLGVAQTHYGLGDVAQKLRNAADGIDAAIGGFSAKAAANG